MAVPGLKLKANAKARVLAGHPWVFVNEVEGVLGAEHDGGVVECRDRTGRLLGTGICNSRSQIVWRRLSRERVELDEAYIRGAVRRALSRRTDGAARRVVWSESDDLPGVVADQFGDTIVLQIQTLAMEQRAELVATALAEAVSAKEVILRNDAPIRRLEGLPQEVRTRSGAPWEPRWFGIDGVEYWLDLLHGQKTGFYLDQRQNHLAVAAQVRRLAAGEKAPRVLDAFCNQGGFALQAAKAGAAEVLGIDSAEEAVRAAMRNAERNRLEVKFQAANVFDWLNDPARRSEPLWDLIILDPPPFAKSKGSMEGALRGYKEINLRAMQRLVPGGLLATYTCSHHMHDTELRSVIAEAASDARRHVQVIEWHHQPPDHPVLATMPESEYLRGYLLRVE